MKKPIFSILMLILVTRLFACAGGDGYYEYSYYNFFNQFLLPDKSLHPFLHCPESPFCADNEYIEDKNLIDWQQYFNESADIKDIRELLYQASIDDCVQLQNSLNGISKTELQIKQLTSNSLFKYLKKNKQENILAYFIYAKKCENLTYKPPYSWKQGENWADAQHEGPNYYNNLIEEGIALYQNERDNYLKLRFGFQLVRLAHYNMQHQKALDYFDRYVKTLKLKNYIYYRALEQKAGALHKLGKLAEAATDFITVFKKLSDRREICLHSMSINNENIWNQVANKTNHDPVMYFIRAYKNGSELHEMEKLIEHEINSPYLDVMMLRYLNKIEASFFPRFGEANYRSKFEQSNLEKFNEIIATVTQKKSKNKDLWILAEAYSNVFINQYDTAIYILKDISRSSSFYKQAQILDFVTRIKQQKDSLNEERCNELFVEYSSTELNKNEVIKDYLMQSISDFYLSINKKEVAGLCVGAYNFNSGRYNLMDFNYINRFEKFFNKSHPNEFEEYLIDLAPENINDILIEMRATYFLHNYEPKLAYKELKKLPENFTVKYFDAQTKVNYGFNNEGFPLYDVSIFSGAVRHYFDTSYKSQCDSIHLNFNFLRGENILLNKTDLARLMVEIEEKASQKNANSGLYYYMLGNAWYNLGPDGWFHTILQFRHKKPSEKSSYFSYIAKYSSKVPIKYYKLALENTKDKELEARIHFMIAKTVQYANNYPPLYAQSFQTLKNKYRNTLYYKEIVRECEYFDKYRIPNI